MAYAPIAYTLPQYEDYPNWWMKAYTQGTTTAISIATDAAAGTTAAKVELDAQGFPKTAGAVRFIPHIEGAYDLWLFPTEEEADANDTTNAIQLADNISASIASGAATAVYFDTKADMIAASPTAGFSATTRGYTTAGDGGGGDYLCKTAAQATADGDTIDEIGAGFTAANGNVWVLQYQGNGRTINLLQWGAVADGSNTTALRIACTKAAEYIAGLPDGLGGWTIKLPASNDSHYILDASVDFGTIFNLTTPATQRLTQIWLEGEGRASHIRYTGTDDYAFNWGSYTNNVGMTGGARKLRIDTNASLGHTATVYTPVFTSQSSAAYGTTQTNTTAFLFSTCLSPASVDDVEISLFNKGVQMRNGFAPTVKDCQISKCNIGLEGGDLLTSLTLAGGNTIEECAVGWFINSGGQMFKTSGINVIEANDVDILIYANTHLHDLSGIYHEGSRRSHYINTDGTTDQFTPRQIKLENCIGLDIESNGGLHEFFVTNSAFSGGLELGVNTSQRLQHIVLEDCYSGNRGEPFDASLIAGSGIYSQFTDEVIVRSSGKDVPYLINGDPKLRPNSELRQSKQFYKTSGDTLINGFSIDVPNLKLAALIVIEGHKNYDVEVGGSAPNPVLFKYVGIVSRDTGGSASVSWFASESVFDATLATTLTPYTISTPTTAVIGATSGTQNVGVAFIRGYSGNIFAGHYYTVTIQQSVGNIEILDA